MTTVNEDTGRILWSTESKYYLLRLIRENSIIISPDVSAETMTKKEEAWLGIEESFAADGMPCQLSKLKRLWKRMKDTARQNMLKYNALKKQTSDQQQQLSIQQANVKAPTELDLEVAELIARRNMHKKNSRRNKSANNKLRSAGSSEPPPQPLDEYNSFEELQQHHRPNGYHDALEPVTILEEFEQSQINDDENDGDVMMMDPHQIKHERTPNIITADERLLGCDDGPTTTTTTVDTTKQLQSVLMLHEIKLRELQRQNEQERMDNERELFRKQSKLLDLQIKKATLELNTINGGGGGGGRHQSSTMV